MPLAQDNSSQPRCTDYWHRMPYYMRAPRCTVCGEIHPDGIIIEDEYLKMRRGEEYVVTFQDHVERKRGNLRNAP